MSSVRIRTRTTRRGDRRYMVAYRLGGRYGRDRSAGTFETLTLARTRRMKVMELIARGEHDQIPELANPGLATTAEPAGTWTELHQQWIDGTHNLKPSTRNTYQRHGRSLAQVIGDRDPTRFDWKDCLDLVTNLVERGLAPRTVKAYIDTLKLALDFAGVEPNPARDRRVKLPRQTRQTTQRIPSRAHIRAIRTHLPQHLLIPFDTLEATGIRVGELNNLTCGRPRHRGVQGSGSPKARPPPPGAGSSSPQRSPTKSTPPGPQADIATEHRLFPMLHERTIGYAIGKACKHAGTPHYHPHDLRDRWISLALKRGVPPAEVAQRRRPRTPSESHSTPTATSSPTPTTTTPSPGKRTDPAQTPPQPAPNQTQTPKRADTVRTQPQPNDKTPANNHPNRKRPALLLDPPHHQQTATRAGPRIRVQPHPDPPWDWVL